MLTAGFPGSWKIWKSLLKNKQINKQAKILNWTRVNKLQTSKTIIKPENTDFSRSKSKEKRVHNEHNL